ncbi:predicted protein [Histoplasma capsulatum var. duboisii H88]|uniref:Predicted protein n=1 Tax=Ajellomyces capsulatus (strain H88) TaxID=544711 RepID=F0U671_AJEC8|nr:predicted protein [Histoplasma capsulatum var. duboisii H88]
MFETKIHTRFKQVPADKALASPERRIYAACGISDQLCALAAAAVHQAR